MKTDEYNLAAIKRPTYHEPDTDEEAEASQIPMDDTGGEDSRESKEIAQSQADADKPKFGKDNTVWIVRLLWFDHAMVFLLLVFAGFGDAISFNLDPWVLGLLLAVAFGISGAHIFKRILASVFSG